MRLAAHRGISRCVRRSLRGAPRVGARAATAGFTLVEVLVAMFIMAILATLSWQALDGVVRSRDASRESIDRTVRLSTVLAQWEQDLQAVYDTETVPAIDFAGQTLRLTRRAENGVALVAWSVRSGVWQRWSGPAYVRAADLQQAWLRSQQFQGTEPGHLKLADGVDTWQVYFSRGGQWTNPQSTGDLVRTVTVSAPPPPDPVASGAGSGTPNAAGAAASAASAPEPLVQERLRVALPEGVRLQITIGGKTLLRDIALGPGGS